MGSKWLFNFGAIPYELITNQEFWHNQILQTLNYIDKSKNLQILDVGCGPGVSTFVLAKDLRKSQVIGIDCAGSMIERACQHHKRKFKYLNNVVFQQEDASSLSFADRSFDLVVGHSFIYLVENRLAVLNEIRRVLKPGGVAVFMEPNANGSLWKAFPVALQHSNELFLRPKAALFFVVSMIMWRTYSRFPGRFTPELLQKLFAEANFAEVSLYPTLAGLGFHCVGKVH